MKIGIDIGGSHIAVGLVDNNYRIVLKKEHDWTKQEKVNLVESIKQYAKRFIEEMMEETEGEKIEKIGIGFPHKHIVDGIVYLREQEFNLTKFLSDEFNIPVYLKNDVKCSAICEKNIGNLRDYDNCLFMTLGTGIGGAHFYKNELVVPNKYSGLEIGHMIIQIDGKQCRCGQKGCFEEYASMRIFRKEISNLFCLEDINSDKMFEILESKQKEEEVQKIIDKYIKYLSIGMINLINIFEIDAICIGGSFVYYAPIFMEKLMKEIRINFNNRDIPDLLLAKYANDAGIIGASMLTSN